MPAAWVEELNWSIRYFKIMFMKIRFIRGRSTVPDEAGHITLKGRLHKMRKPDVHGSSLKISVTGKEVRILILVELAEN